MAYLVTFYNRRVCIYVDAEAPSFAERAPERKGWTPCPASECSERPSRHAAPRARASATLGLGRPRATKTIMAAPRGGSTRA